jgi:hypothetical protein
VHEPVFRPAGLPNRSSRTATPVPRPLFPLFYLVEIRYSQLPQSQSGAR